jgi:uncharacterized protein (TIGR02118 family)
MDHGLSGRDRIARERLAMQINFTSFNYKPGADIGAEEKHYLDYHVKLAKTIPGLRLYLTGKFRQEANGQPAHRRAAILGFDDRATAAASMKSDISKRVFDDGAAHLADVRRLSLDSTVIVPFASKQIEREYFVLAGEFDLKAGAEGIEAADRRYLKEHTALAAQLPGVRFYVTGRQLESGGNKPERFRCAILAWDSFEDFQAAFNSPIREKLIKDEEATIANILFHHIDAVARV